MPTAVHTNILPKVYTKRMKTILWHISAIRCHHFEMVNVHRKEYQWEYRRRQLLAVIFIWKLIANHRMVGNMC